MDIKENILALYYSGRENPPHPEIWINYFLRMVKLYSRKSVTYSWLLRRKILQDEGVDISNNKRGMRPYEAVAVLGNS